MGEETEKLSNLSKANSKCVVGIPLTPTLCFYSHDRIHQNINVSKEKDHEAIQPAYLVSDDLMTISLLPFSLYASMVL